MSENSAERRVEAAEPARRAGAALTRSMSYPQPANDNAAPLALRLAAIGMIAAALAGAATLFQLFG